jgi:hypothetical protein
LLQRGEIAFPSQIQPNQGNDSPANGEVDAVVVVAAIAATPLDVVAERAH